MDTDVPQHDGPNNEDAEMPWPSWNEEAASMPAQANSPAEQGNDYFYWHAETGLTLPPVIMGRILRKRDPWAM